MTDHDSSLSRRRFLKTALAGGAAMAAAPLGAALPQTTTGTQTQAQPAPAAQPPVPTRKLGRSGIQVSMINMGGAMGAHSPQYLDQAWRMGIRYFDTADCYINGQSEQHVAQWLKRYPERRKDLFLVTKDHPNQSPKLLLEMIDKRLAACGTDYIDLFFIHWINPKEYGEGSYEWLKGKELRDVADQLKKSGKIKLIGFSCHDATCARYLQAAAEGGIVDAAMFSYTPLLPPSDELSRAMDACAKAGVGMIAMKTMRAHSEMPKRLPDFDKLGLTTHEALLHAVWSDERVSSICSAMDNIEQMTMNVGAARKYKGPLKTAQIERLRELALAHDPSMCPNCDGRCQLAAGRTLALNDIARYVTYYERDGNLEARDFYRQLPEQLRQIAGADLDAARHACLCHLDFAKIMKKAEEYFA